MELQATLFTIWNWLPAFHVVAQTEHLPTASRRLHVSVSALSRTIKLLESALGYELFRRSGRNLVLNERGRRWRAVMEKLIEGFAEELARLGASSSARVVHVAIAGSLSQRLLAPAVVRAAARLGAIPNLHGCSDAEALALVAGGEVEVALVRAAGAAPGVTVRAVGSLPKSLYAGIDRPDAEQLFIAHPGGDGRARNVGAYVQQEDTALQLCLAGQGVAVLPDALAEPYVARRQLRRIADEAPAPLYVAHRASAEALVAALERDLRSLGAPPVVDEGAARWQLGDALALRGEYAAALREYATSARGWRRAGMPKSAAVAHQLRRARVALLRGEHAAVERLCARARAAKSAIVAQRAEAEALVALSHSVRGNAAAAEQRLVAARSLAEALSSDDAEARRAWLAVHRAEGNARVSGGRPADAVAAYESAARVAEALDDRWEHSIASFNLAEAYLHAGDLERAATMLERAAAEKTEIGDRWGLCHVQHARALLQLLRGRAGDALAETARGLATAIDLDNGRLTAMLHIVGGRAQLLRGDADEAARAFRFAARAAARAGAAAEGIQARIGLCDASLKRGAVAEAWRAAEEARRQAARLTSKDARAAALVACAAVQRRRKAHAAAARSWAAAASLVPSPTRLYGHWFAVELLEA
jgi:DNA-binding transcriptional LysR family regulator